MDAKTPDKPERTRKPKEQHLCRIHEKVAFWKIEGIHENVCVPESEHALDEFEGYYYCLFHLPTKNKDIVNFERIFKVRLQKHDDAIAKIEAEFPDDKDAQANAISEQDIDYDFRYVWFPSRVDLTEHNFKAFAYFSSATFSGDAKFRSAIFSAKAVFSKANFSDSASFRSATFEDEVDFYKATFNEVNFESANFKDKAQFRSATFSANANFDSAIFEAKAYFGEVTFLADAYFRNAQFIGKTETFFNDTQFTKTTLFDDTLFENDVSFNSAIFGSNSDVFFLRTSFGSNVDFQYCIPRGLLRFSELQGDKHKFDFQEMVWEKAWRVSFTTMDLYPHWFVNVDSRKFVFIDIKWKNYSFLEKTIKIDTELIRLDDREIRERNKRLFEIVVKKREKTDADTLARKHALKKYKFEPSDLTILYNDLNKNGFSSDVIKIQELKDNEQNKRLLEIACRNLAVNAEENNRYVEASQFRYMAMEIFMLRYNYQVVRLSKLPYWKVVGLPKFPYLSRLYKISSLYGESWWRAFWVLLVVLFIFGLVYACPLLSSFDYIGGKDRNISQQTVEQVSEIATPIQRFHSMGIGEGIVHSLAVASFQRPEPKPDGFWTRLFVTLEAILAPLQAALLALAIRRKFMR